MINHYSTAVRNGTRVFLDPAIDRRSIEARRLLEVERVIARLIPRELDEVEEALVRSVASTWVGVEKLRDRLAAGDPDLDMDLLLDFQKHLEHQLRSLGLIPHTFMSPPDRRHRKAKVENEGVMSDREIDEVII